MSKRVDAGVRSEWVRRWRASGLSCAQFAARHGLSKATLYTWSYQVGRTPVLSTRASRSVTALARVPAQRSWSGRGQFTQVRVVGSSSASSLSAASGGVIEVVLGEVRVVRVLGAVDESALRSVLRVVGEC